MSNPYSLARAASAALSSGIGSPASGSGSSYRYATSRCVAMANAVSQRYTTSRMRCNSRIVSSSTPARTSLPSAALVADSCLPYSSRVVCSWSILSNTPSTKTRTRVSTVFMQSCGRASSSVHRYRATRLAPLRFSTRNPTPLLSSSSCLSTAPMSAVGISLLEYRPRWAVRPSSGIGLPGRGRNA